MVVKLQDVLRSCLHRLYIQCQITCTIARGAAHMVLVGVNRLYFSAGETGLMWKNKGEKKPHMSKTGSGENEQ